MLKYRQKLDEFNITDLSNKDLDPAFVAKATDFEKKIENNSLTDEEIKTTDDELCALFDEVHDFEEVPSEEVIQLQTQNTILSGKQEVEKATTLEQLKAIAEDKYKDFPDVIEFAKEKAIVIKEELKKQVEKENAEKKAKAEAEKAKTDEEEKKQAAQNKNTEIQTKLLSQSAWSYNQLRELGINPTGDSIIVAHGIKLRKKLLLYAYEVEGKIS